ncbi:hypothetical protein SD77_3951 [Bacillus badius]|uniref:Ribose 5-phosphate isomerase B n=1 Tax=Bacillus badius TaxID=1455 RepID=A0ABR5AV78_BACBA|nr:hypothetical protein SD77_3951 [Bacillus badius]
MNSYFFIFLSPPHGLYGSFSLKRARSNCFITHKIELYHDFLPNAIKSAERPIPGIEKAAVFSPGGEKAAAFLSIIH